MTLDEAFEKATKGPFRIDKCQCSDECKSYYLQGPYQCDGRFSEADALLLAHCFNHFQELVKALEAAEEHLDWCGYGDSYERQCAKEAGLPKRIEEALAKAKQVKP